TLPSAEGPTTLPSRILAHLRRVLDGPARLLLSTSTTLRGSPSRARDCPCPRGLGRERVDARGTAGTPRRRARARRMDCRISDLGRARRFVGGCFSERPG